jgi:two-component system chemotaxis response regulator CheB
VLVVDDSPTARELLVAILQIAEDVQVVGTGATGEDALRLSRRMRPDVVLMDISMPKLDGLEATRCIMKELPIPIVLVTGTLMRSEVDLSFEALQAGALTVLAKPGLGDAAACDQLVQTVKSMARVPVVRRWASGGATPRRTPPSPPQRAIRRSVRPTTQPPVAVATSVEKDLLRRRSIIGIASSTGGPGALARLLKPLPASFPLPILVVQHVTPGFATGFAEWLDGETTLHVRLASHGDEPRPGSVLVAPDDYHLQVDFRGLVELYKDAPYHGLRPSANYLFRTLARIYGPRAVGIVLTGMGDDGAEGLIDLHAAGGLILAQDEASCVVYGMPQEAVRRGTVNAVLPLNEIGVTLRKFTTLRDNHGG